MLSHMTLTFELDLNVVKTNHHVRHLRQRSFSSKVIVRSHIHTHSGPIALHGLLNWSVIIRALVDQMTGVRPSARTVCPRCRVPDIEADPYFIALRVGPATSVDHGSTSKPPFTSSPAFIRRPPALPPCREDAVEAREGCVAEGHGRYVIACSTTRGASLPSSRPHTTIDSRDDSRPPTGRHRAPLLRPRPLERRRSRPARHGPARPSGPARPGLAGVLFVTS